MKCREKLNYNLNLQLCLRPELGRIETPEAALLKGLVFWIEMCISKLTGKGSVSNPEFQFLVSLNA